MRISLSGNMPISVLFSLGALKTGYDLYTSKEKDKKNTFIRDSVIIGSSIIGVSAAQKYSDFLIKQRPIKALVNKTTELFTKIRKPKFIEKITKPFLDANRDKTVTKLEETTEFTKIMQNCLKDCFSVTSAILSGLLGAEILNHTYFKKNPTPKLKETDINKTAPNYNVVENPDDGIEQLSKMLEADFKVFKAFDKPLAVFDAIKIADEKNIDTKVKMTAYEIIANALLPTFFISLAMSLTKNLNMAKRICAVGASGLLGLLMGHKLAVQFNRRFAPQITETVKELHEDITETLTPQPEN